jgi:hypothetical protein
MVSPGSQMWISFVFFVVDEFQIHNEGHKHAPLEIQHAEIISPSPSVTSFQKRPADTMKIDLLIWSSRLRSFSMRRPHKIVAAIVVVLFVVAGSYGQSLGDVAREQRQKQPKDAHATRKVLTNEDMPDRPEESTSTVTDEHDTAPPSPASNGTHAGEQWKAKIEAQKNSIASLQSQIDKLNSSIHFVEANRYYNGVQHNERQIQKQDEVQRMQKQLDEQKKQLEDMQESARKAGLGSAVYEP